MICCFLQLLMYLPSCIILAGSQLSEEVPSHVLVCDSLAYENLNEKEQECDQLALLRSHFLDFLGFKFKKDHYEKRVSVFWHDWRIYDLKLQRF